MGMPWIAHSSGIDALDGSSTYPPPSCTDSPMLPFTFALGHSGSTRPASAACSTTRQLPEVVMTPSRAAESPPLPEGV